MVRSRPIVKMQWDAITGTWVRQYVAVDAVESDTVMEQRELDRIADNAADEVAAMEQSWLTKQGKLMAQQRRRDALIGVLSFALGVALLALLLAHLAAGM